MKTIGLKNNICVKNELATCGSKILEGYVSPYDSYVAQKLKEANIKINNIDTTEFGLKDDSFIQDFFEKDISKTAIITDRSGETAKKSIDGVIGLKPTFGIVSRYGVVTTAPSLEQVAILSKSIDELKETFAIIKGYDKRDSGSVKEFEQYNKDLKDIKIGFHQETTNTFKNFNKEKINIENLKYVKAIHYIISASEASSNLGRYDGIRFGQRAQDAVDWKDVYIKTRQEGFSIEAKRQMLAGTFFLDLEQKEKYYIKAEKIRTVIKDELKSIFKKVDVIAMDSDSEGILLANLTGRPSLTVNKTTLIGEYFSEEMLISLVDILGNEV